MVNRAVLSSYIYFVYKYSFFNALLNLILGLNKLFYLQISRILSKIVSLNFSEKFKDRLKSH